MSFIHNAFGSFHQMNHLKIHFFLSSTIFFIHLIVLTEFLFQNLLFQIQNFMSDQNLFRIQNFFGSKITSVQNTLYWIRIYFSSEFYGSEFNIISV